MIGPEELEKIRAMTPGQRLQLGLQLMNLAWEMMRHLPKEEIQRRLDLAKEPWNPPPGRMQE